MGWCGLITDLVSDLALKPKLELREESWGQAGQKQQTSQNTHVGFYTPLILKTSLTPNTIWPVSQFYMMRRAIWMKLPAVIVI